MLHLPSKQPAIKTLARHKRVKIQSPAEIRLMRLHSEENVTYHNYSVTRLIRTPRAGICHSVRIIWMSVLIGP